MSTAAMATPPVSRPWYREPFVWMVIGGPLVVVVASIITFGLAASKQDPVLMRDVAPKVDQEALEKLDPAARAKLLESLEPAIKARNHVASPAKEPAQP